MKYIVVVFVVLITAVISAGAYAFLPRLKQANQELDDQDGGQDQAAPENRIKPAAVFFSTVKGLLPRQWITIAICLVFNGLAAVRLQAVSTNPFTFARMIATAVMLAAVMIIDGNTRRIPNIAVISSAIFGALIYFLQLLIDPIGLRLVIIGAVVGALGNLFLFYVMSRLTKEGIGMGDVKLLASLGWTTGIQISLASVLFSLLLCCFAAIGLIFTKKKKASDSVPFGPFIYFGYVIALLICNF